MGVTAHYEAGLGIRPPRKSGKVRGVAREVVPGGGAELWHCDHDHAPGVRSCQILTPAQQEEASRCARDWIAGQIRDGALLDMPVRYDPSFPSGSWEPAGPPGAAELNEDQLGYLRSLVRMDLRKQFRAIARFEVRPGQDLDEAAAVLAGFRSGFAFRKAAYQALGGDPERMTPETGETP
jgi:hypothetical protein